MARKILLADDSVTAQNMGRKILADAGYEVIAVNNGSAALKKIGETKPDLVILDVYMPGYSGLEVCQRMKESPETARIPVLLTVGKLEPFKPEEAQRVRAEGYIVKPFEASELLSALSKLEDKVVPRAEASRSGRFARAIAAVEEVGFGRRGRSDETNGWKNRIGFPHEKSDDEKKSSEQNADDQFASYNPVNRDLRTVVETPEELAAEKRSEAKPAHSQQEETKRGEEKREESLAMPGNQADEKQHAAKSSAESSVDMTALAASGALPPDVTEEEVSALAAAVAQMQMASAAIQEGDKDETKKGSSAEGIVQSEESTRDLPVTIAATAESVAELGSGAPRWTAVAVALDGEEASMSLDQEMQKAYASTQTPVIEAAYPESSSLEASDHPQDLREELPAAVPAAPIETAAQPSEPQPEPTAAVSTSEASFSVQEPQPVPPSFASAEPAIVTAPANVSSWQSETQETPAVCESPSIASHSEDPVAAAGIETNSSIDEASEAPASEIRDAADPSVDSPDSFQGFRRFERQEVSEPAGSSNTFTYNSEPSTQAPAEVQSASEVHSAEGRPDSSSPAEHEDVKTTAAAWASWRQIRDSSKPADIPSPDSQPVDFAATEHPVSGKDNPDTNAAAVAAGAEQILQAVRGTDPSSETNSNSHDVASIVDSVLADLRPKLMEEISRKMAAKK